MRTGQSLNELTIFPTHVRAIRIKITSSPNARVALVKGQCKQLFCRCKNKVLTYGTGEVQSKYRILVTDSQDRKVSGLNKAEGKSYAQLLRSEYLIIIRNYYGICYIEEQLRTCSKANGLMQLFKKVSTNKSEVKMFLTFFDFLTIFNFGLYLSTKDSRNNGFNSP